MSILDREHYEGNLIDELVALRRRVEALERDTPYTPTTLRVKYSEDNVSSPPTDAQLDTAFGSPSEVMHNFIGLIDDNGANTTVWLVLSNGTSWWYVQLTKAT